MENQNSFWKMIVISMFVGLVLQTNPTIGHSANDDLKAKGSFTDVTHDYWAVEEIAYLTLEGIIKGYNNGEFGPKDNVTRGQAAVMVTRALEINTENITNPKLPDVKEDHSAYREIAAVIDQGIFDLVDSFHPNEPLTRGEMAKILVRSYDLKGDYGEYFTDVSLDNEYYPYINKLFANGITTGFPNKTFKPNQPITRDQFAVFFARVLDSKFKPSLINNNFLELAKSGILNGCNYSLNGYVTSKDILGDNGKPEEEGYMFGLKRKLFGNCYYYTVDYNDDSDELITAIDYYTDESNLTIQDIKKFLGEPHDGGYDEHNGLSTMIYRDEAYFLTFMISDESSKPSVIFFTYKMSEEKARYHLLNELGLLNNPNVFVRHEATHDESSDEYYFEVCQDEQQTEEEAQCVPIGFYYVDKFIGDIRQELTIIP
ncbi:S-layer homology domain-containing protein [Bacillus sp. SM2101]|uniref:S-layer homology domain-containing protein n=1 Tax=Bacillus sp. SM2101 TaxID=2805366 RepID=UPI001BDE56F2|nr:S-layer homology domain-containing protein [Bacillus sp. SM2101]